MGRGAARARPRGADLRGLEVLDGEPVDISEGTAKGAPKKEHAVNADEIRLRAYEIYCSRGAGEGDALTDWFRAEQDVRVARALRGTAEDPPLQS